MEQTVKLSWLIFLFFCEITHTRGVTKARGRGVKVLVCASD